MIRRLWVLVPILASTATQCDETPRGAVPTRIAPVELVLTSVPEPPPADQEAFLQCFIRMGSLPTHVRPSWRASLAEPEGAVVILTETEPNRFTGQFPDVPVDTLNVMTVHDINECARDPAGSGHVTMGITVNGTAITTIVGEDNALAFEIDVDGTVKAPPMLPAPST